MADNNGGAVAIKGFNFQTMAVIFFIVNNIDDDKFSAYVESEEDFTLDKNGYKSYVQVKARKLSLKLLLKTALKDSGDIEPSILEKNLSSADDGEFLIYTKELAAKDLKSMIKKSDIFVNEEDVYVFSEEQKKSIVDVFKKDGFGESLIKNLNNSRLFVSKFGDSLKDSQRYLIGLMSEKKIDITGDRAKMALNELFFLVHKKAEYLVQKGYEKDDYEKKKLTSDELKSIFKKAESRSFFYKFVEDTNYSTLFKDKVTKIRNEIFNEYYVERKMLNTIFDSQKLDFDCPNQDLINKMKLELDSDKDKFDNCDKYVKVSLIIDYISERAVQS